MMGLFFEEIIIGRTISLGTYTFTDDSINRFRRQFAPVPLHLSGEVASAGLFGKPVAAGFHICCGWMSCFVATNTRAREWMAGNGMKLPEIGPSPGLENLCWPHPVATDDIIHYTVTAADKRLLKSRSGWGIVTAHGTGSNKLDVKVLDFVSRILVATR
jgi:acyl dehydratase